MSMPFPQFKLCTEEDYYNLPENIHADLQSNSRRAEKP